MLGIIVMIAVITLVVGSLIMFADMAVEIIRIKRSWDISTCTILAMLFSGIILVAVYTIQVLMCWLGI